MAANGIANALFNSGDLSRADYYYRQARQIFDQTGDLYNLAFIENNLGGIALKQGRLEDALSYYQRSLRILEQLGGSPYVVGVLHMNLGATLVRRGEFGMATDHLDRSLGCFTTADARDFLPELYRHFAAVALGVEDYVLARERGGAALQLARELAMRAEEALSLQILGEIARAQGDLALAEGHLTESLAILEEVRQEYELACARLSLAGVRLRQGRSETAGTLLAQATEIFKRLEARLDLAAAEQLRQEMERHDAAPAPRAGSG
jgi:tetratricopeptide (TPR) repeat protein